MNDVFGKKLGQYILLEQMGEGGMAKVYNALDSRVDRNVAIKVILPSKRTSSVFLQSFEREAKVLAKLTHTNIVKVLNYGVENGQPYLVMEYVAGGTLKEAMNQKIPWQTAAAILAPIARALDYVHQQQVVHRDVKPSNILLQEDFTPMLSDFGILQLLESKDEKVDSAIGTGIGTPEYMPPEQGMGKDVDFRADIYSLGLVFYEMITGQKPYTADSPMAMVIKHVTDKMPLPTAIDKNIPRFVERAILRAVQKDPKKRYMSMGQFADVLELIALGEKAPLQKINKVASAREKRQLSISIIVLSVLLVILSAGTFIFAYNYFKGTQQQANNAALTSAALTAQITPTRQSTPTKPPAQTAASPTVPPITTPNSPSPSLTLLGTPITSNRPSQYQEIARWGIGGVNVVAWSPDGTTIALGTTSGIFIYDAETKESTLFIDTQFDVVTMAFNPVSDEVTAGSPHGIVKAWDTRSGKENQSFTYARPASDILNNDTTVTAISYSSDGEDIAVGYGNGVIDYFPSHQATSSHQLDNHPTVGDLVISSNKQFIYASNGSKEVNAWELQFKEKSSLSNPTPVNKLSLFTGEQQFLLASGNSVYMWDLNESEPKLVSSFTNLGGRVTDFDLSHDNKYVGIGLNTGAIKVYEIPRPQDYSKTFQPLQVIDAYENEQILSIAFSPTALVIASGNHEEGLKLWDALSGKDLFDLNQSMRAIDEIYFSNDGKWLATSHEDGSLRVWDVNAGQKTDYSPMTGYLSKGIPFSPDNRFLAFIYSPGKNKMDVIRILDLKEGKVVAELPGYIPKSFVQFSPDSKLLAMGNAYSASLWDVSTWEQVDTHGGPTAGCGQYFTPQNKLLTLISDAGIMFTNLFDEQLQDMCGTAAPGATLVYYFYQPHKMVFVLGNETGDIWTWGFSGPGLSRIGSSTPYPLSSKIFLAADQSSGWYAYAARGTIIVKNISGATGTTIDDQSDYQYRVALLPGQKLMALGSRYGSIHIWTMP